MMYHGQIHHLTIMDWKKLPCNLQLLNLKKKFGCIGSQMQHERPLLSHVGHFVAVNGLSCGVWAPEYTGSVVTV